jgi:transposase
MEKVTRNEASVTVGLDLGDKYSRWCVLDESGELLEEGRVATTERALTQRFSHLPPARVALEVGTHSPWVQRLLSGLGHEVLVANPRKLRLIYRNESKDDRLDAERLARLARVDPKLLHPIRHRDGESQEALAVLRSRQALVEARAKLVNHVRGAVKSHGSRLKSCSTASFHKQASSQIPDGLRPALTAVLEMIGDLTQRIRRSDQQIEQLAEEHYPETTLLRQVSGVGALTALWFVLVLGDPHRFGSSRRVGAYLGLRPRRSQSGENDPELRITKTGDKELRRLLVTASHYILGPFGVDSDLRRWGLALAVRGRKNAKKRAVVAVARKLAVLLHALWVSAEEYEPLRNSQAAA